jgi:hypothetical protein
MIRIKRITTILGLTGAIVFSGCSLDEELRQDITGDQAAVFGGAAPDPNVLLAAAYNSTATFMTQDRIWSLQEHPTDELIPPTRAANWDDNGDWRQLHALKWTSEHTLITAAFNELLTGAFNAGNILKFDGLSASVKAEARFLRAFFFYHVLDTWGQFPYREPGSDLLKLPTTYNAEDGTNFLITEVESIMNDLPDGTLANSGKANKNAARVLLAKLYLNKGAYINRQSPSFASADMQKVIDYCDDIINSGEYSLTDIYFNNFTPDNTTVSTENIFVTPGTQGVNQAFGNGLQSRWFCTLHYSQTPGGWNGFATLADFYDKFDDNDIRKSYNDPVAKSNGGYNLGFLEGQQYTPAGDPIDNLIYTKDVALIEKGANLDYTGVRVIKYRPDYGTPFQPGNDYVHFRYADVLLMKAEALLRNGDGGSALTVVNEIRNKRIEPDDPFASLSLENLLDERGRELYWEGYRRQDLIRFGKFLAARSDKAGESDPKYLVYPIPLSQLAVNPNLKQNEGY